MSYRIQEKKGYGSNWARAHFGAVNEFRTEKQAIEAVETLLELGYWQDPDEFVRIVDSSGSVVTQWG